MSKNTLPVAISRRYFTRQVGVGLLLALGSCHTLAKLKHLPYWAGTAKQGGFYWLIIFDAQGQVLRQIKLPNRAHGLQQSAQGQLVVSSRRPGLWMLMLQHPLAPAQWLQVPANRPLSGHCCFSTDGQFLYTAENNIDMGKGSIGIWDGHIGRRLEEWSSQGIGPHEIQLSHDSSHLWVANGGILTHPKSGREKLNLATMAANISYLCLSNGGLIRQYSLNEPQLSLRHISVNSRNQVAVACQYEGPAYVRKNLLLLVSGGYMNYLDCDPKITVELNNYLGSVTFDISGQWLSASSPRGHRVVIWHLAKGSVPMHCHTLAITDACGLSASGQEGGFVISTGMGGVYHFAATTNILTQYPSLLNPVAWDSHLIYVSV